MPIALLNDFERAIGDEGLFLDGIFWRGALSKNMMHLLDHEVDMGIDVNLPRWIANVPQFVCDGFADLLPVESFFAKETVAVSVALLVKGEESYLR